MALSRRAVLAGAAGGALWPALSRGEVTADGFQILEARPVRLKLLEDDSVSTAAWSFGGAPHPPVLRARQGEALKVRIVNGLDAPIWLHWFGVRGPSELMTLNIDPGQANAVDCVFVPPDAGTFWFGPLANASRQRDMGLYGMLVVAEAPPVPALHEVTLVIDDWKLGDDGTIVGNFGDLDAAAGEGRLGNWFTVNSRYRPRLDMPAAGATRLRLLNVANVRSLSLQFKGADPLLLALDGQPVRPTHLSAAPFVLAPGQRADILVPEGRDDVTVALDLFEDVVEIAYLGRKEMASAAVVPDNFALPANRLAVPELGAARTIPLVIEGGAKGGLRTARVHGEEMDLRALLERGFAWAFNGSAGPGGPLVVSAAAGETVVIEVDNRTAFDQPLHIHGHVWRKVGPGDAGAAETPWRDTAVVQAHGAMRLAFVADNPGTWAIQSLVAERCDAGLLAAFVVG